MEFTGSEVQVVDDEILPSELSKIFFELNKTRWRFGWPVQHGPFARPCWHKFIAGSQRAHHAGCESELRELNDWGFLADLWCRVKSKYLDRETLVGVYANGQTCGQDTPIHRDNRPGLPGKTVVVFCNSHWASAWGGELMFYTNDKADLIKSVMPKPGRIVIFDGEIPHSAKAPNMSCAELRVTLAFKTLNKEVAE